LDETSGRKVLIFFDGYLYEFPRNGKGGQVTKFDKSTFFLRPSDITPVEYKIKATATSKLARSHNPSDIAELQWRLSIPISTMLLALLGVPLSRTAPRQGKYAKLVTAVVVYAIYYNLSGMAKMWVEQGVIGTIPGIWWVQVLLAGLLLVLILPSGSPLRR
jgi:lipopolysaccharide export system permease protein